MNISKYIGAAVAVTLFCTASQAEQDLPITVVEGNTAYQSRLNFVEAFDKQSKKVFWETVLYKDIEPAIYIPDLEKDVQWIVIKELKIEGRHIRATDSKDRVYLLNKKTGKIEG